MSADENVAQALQLLHEAGHLDLLAVGPLLGARPIRWASDGVVVTVFAYSPPQRDGAGVFQLMGAAGKPSRHRDTSQQVQLVRWRTPERPTTLEPSECRVHGWYADKKVLVAVEAKDFAARGLSRLVKGVYALDTGAGMDNGSPQSGGLVMAEEKSTRAATVDRNKQDMDRTLTMWSGLASGMMGGGQDKGWELQGSRNRG
ncbi:hypothetical protein NDU88_002273 [Pleurodeles waltl]|uniref:Uncharacterized protein n=1 Tax=Pleurodeles waltl TaxID=8319 RepID=A0AAV7RFB8_PLEWA|nr:hypothetical protein NDU88_002273 [Pleurodeles waltl]